MTRPNTAKRCDWVRQPVLEKGLVGGPGAFGQQLSVRPKVKVRDTDVESGTDYITISFDITGHVYSSGVYMYIQPPLNRRPALI